MRVWSRFVSVAAALAVLSACSIAPEVTGVDDQAALDQAARARTVSTYTETFDSCTATGTSYVTGSFTGVGGWSWAYTKTAWGGVTLTGKTAVLGKGQSPASALSVTVNNGVGTLSFKYKKAYSTATSLLVKVNGTTIATLATSGTTVLTAGPYTVNRTGSVTIQLIQSSTSAGQVAVDDITWTSYEGTASSSSSSVSSSSSSSSSSVSSSSSSSTQTGWVSVAKSLTSPNYPSNYPNSQDITSTLTQPGASKVRVHFSAFNTENNYDKVYIMNSLGTVLATYTGSKGAFTSIEVAGDTVKIRFTSDSSVAASGWKIDALEYTSGTASSSSSVSSSSSSSSSSQSASVKNWTVMVYLDADNNLEAAGLEDMNEMEKGLANAGVAISDNINVIVLLDRATGSSTADGYTSAKTESTGSDWTDTRLYRVRPDSSSMTYFSSERLDDNGSGWGHIANCGEKNMGDPATLSWFINYGKTYFPANNYKVVLWNHGGGARDWAATERPAKAICWDDASGDDCLYLDEVQQALAQRFTSTSKLAILGFDACLMSTVETAYEFRNLASYMVASMQTEQGDGWDYEYIFGNLGSASITPASFATLIVDAYKVQIQANPVGDGETLAATDLSKIAALKTAVDNMAVAMYAENKKSSIESTRNSAVKYYDNTDTYSRQNYPYFDLGSLCSKIAASSTYSTTLKTAANTVLTALGDAVIKAYGETATVASGVSGYGTSYYWGTGSTVKRGLSIFFSYSSSDYGTQDWYTSRDQRSGTSSQVYGNIDFCTFNSDGSVTSWMELMEAWYDPSNTGTPSTF